MRTSRNYAKERTEEDEKERKTMWERGRGRERGGETDGEAERGGRGSEENSEKESGGAEEEERTIRETESDREIER